MSNSDCCFSFNQIEYLPDERQSLTYSSQLIKNITCTHDYVYKYERAEVVVSFPLLIYNRQRHIVLSLSSSPSPSPQAKSSAHHTHTHNVNRPKKRCRRRIRRRHIPTEREKKRERDRGLFVVTR